MALPKVFLFVDNSNIFISSKAVAEQREGRAAKDAVRISFENLLKLALADRALGKAFVVGSIPPEQRVIWERLERQTGVKPELYERGSLTGGEQGLDQCLQVHMLRAINDSEDPQIVVLMTGDGAGYDDGVGFHADMERMYKAGWGIEVIAWEISCRRSLKAWATEKGIFVPLEAFYDSVTFTELGRRAAQLDLNARQVSSPRLSPTQLAEQRVASEYQKKIEVLEKTIRDRDEKAEKKRVGKEKYLKRMARKNNN